MKTADEGLRQTCAEMVRAWAERRLLASRAQGGRGQRDRIAITEEQRQLFEDCADDIERGLP